MEGEREEDVENEEHVDGSEDSRRYMLSPGRRDEI